MRREVLGDDHVDKAIAATTDFNREFQELITRYAWGTIWSRPELDRGLDGFWSLAMTASLGQVGRVCPSCAGRLGRLNSNCAI